MSSYAKYCRDQAGECARRARLASSPEVAVHCRELELRWLRLAEKARAPAARTAIPAGGRRRWSPDSVTSRSSLPGLTPQVGLARLAAPNDAELGQARVLMQSIHTS